MIRLASPFDSEPPEGLRRYRLVPTRGVSDASRWVYAANDESDDLREYSEKFSSELGKPVLVQASPEDGRGIKSLYTVGRNLNEKKGRVR